MVKSGSPPVEIQIAHERASKYKQKLTLWNQLFRTEELINVTTIRSSQFASEPVARPRKMLR